MRRLSPVNLLHRGSVDSQKSESAPSQMLPMLNIVSFRIKGQDGVYRVAAVVLHTAFGAVTGVLSGFLRLF
jgi:hypothetical protein